MDTFKQICREMVVDIKAFFADPKTFWNNSPSVSKFYLITDSLANIGFVLLVAGMVLSYLQQFPLSLMLAGPGLLLILIGFVGGVVESIWGSKRYAIVSVLIWGIVLAFPAYAMISSVAIPIHDISTDLKNPPKFVAAQKLRPDNANSLARQQVGLKTLQRKHYKGVKTLRFYKRKLHPAKVFEKALDLARDEGWDIIAVSPKTRTIEAVASSFFMNFKDDVVIRVGTKRGKRPSVLVDMRSVSRFGRSDLGKNATRIESFLKELGKRVRNKK